MTAMTMTTGASADPADTHAGSADVTAAVLLLSDSRLPAGGHAHSGGVEAAVAAGLIDSVEELDSFLRGRLATTGLVGAALAAFACRHAARISASQAGDSSTDRESGPAGSCQVDWNAIDVEADARTPSPAQRDSSRRQGRGLLRAGRAAWEAPWLTAVAATPDGPHQAVALGAVAAAAGSTPYGAALVAAHLCVSGPASAGVRLLGLDPLAVHAVQARLAGRVSTIARAADAAARRPLATLPSAAGPRLDLLAEFHRRAEVQLFVS